MFGTMGVTELILILAIVLIVFGAGKLPKIGEGVGKALKGFKKEMREVEPPPQAPEQAQAVDAQVVSGGPQPAAPAQPSGFKAVVNKPAVERVMAQQAALKAKQEPAQQSEANLSTMDRQALEAAGMQPPPAAPASKVPNPKDLEKLGSGIGDALRTFREAANDVRRAIDPSMHTIKAEVEAAQKEIQSSIDSVKETPKVEEPPK